MSCGESESMSCERLVYRARASRIGSTPPCSRSWPGSFLKTAGGTPVNALDRFSMPRRVK